MKQTKMPELPPALQTLQRDYRAVTAPPGLLAGTLRALPTRRQQWPGWLALPAAALLLIVLLLPRQQRAPLAPAMEPPAVSLRQPRQPAGSVPALGALRAPAAVATPRKPDTPQAGSEPTTHQRTDREIQHGESHATA